MKKIYFLSFLMLLITSYMAFAYDSSDLIAYYNFSQVGNQTNLVSNNYVLTSIVTGEGVNSTCISGNCLVFSGSNTGGYNTTFADGFLSGDWTINLWIWSYGLTNSQKYLILSNSSTFNNVVNRTYYFLPTVSNTRLRDSYGNYIIDTTNIIENGWNLITISHQSEGYIHYIKNGNMIYSGYEPLDTSIKYLRIGGPLYYDKVDEVSVFNRTLSANEINYIYNGGNGLSYTETLIYNSVSETAETNTLEWIDICYIPVNYICHHLYYNNSLGLVCPITEQEICPISCIDNSTYWNNVSQSPIDKNYSARCSYNTSVFQSGCTEMYTLKCIGDDIYSCLYDSTNLWNWKKIATCDEDSYCSSGTCINYPVNNGNATDSNGVSGRAKDLFNNFFGLSGNNSTDRLAIAIIVIVVMGMIGLGIVFALTSASGGRLPAFLTIGIVVLSVLLPLVYFMLNGFIPLWATLLMFTLIGLAVASRFTKQMFPMGG